MSAEKRTQDDRAHDIAVRIFVELVARNTEVTQDSVKMGASAVNLATLSLKLSDAFLKAEAEAILAKEPVKNYSLQADDVASWGTK